MQLELSKKDKKIAREIIEKGLQKEFAKGLFSFDELLNKWKDAKLNNQEVYHQLYKKVKGFDKQIARRYDGMTGSKYLIIIMGQYADGLISDDDIAGLDDNIKNVILHFAKG